MTREELERLLSDAAPSALEQRFDAGFADRVMNRIEAGRAQDRDASGALAAALARQARRTLPALAAASLAISAWNWWSVRDRADSSLSAALGFEKISLATALSNSALVDAEELR
jgi:hypothetical protein